MAYPVTVEALAQYVGADPMDDVEFLQSCLAEAGLIVARLAGVADLDAVVAGGKVPEPIIGRAVLDTAADQFSRRRARNGLVELGGDGIVGDVVRISRDPAAAARPILAPWLGPALA